MILSAFFAPDLLAQIMKKRCHRVPHWQTTTPVRHQPLVGQHQLF
jgi:hypothetical protein